MCAKNSQEISSPCIKVIHPFTDLIETKVAL